MGDNGPPSGRARAKARGRASGAPGAPASIQRMHAAQQPPPVQHAPQVPAAAGRAAIRPQGSAGPQRLVEAMASLGISSHPPSGISAVGGGDASSGRGALRGRREISKHLFIRTRPSHITKKAGEGGISIKLTTNYFKLMTATDWCLYQYRIDFDPEEELIHEKKRLLRVHAAKFGGYIFDGTLLFTTCVLHPDPMELYSERESDQTKVRITVKKVGDLAMGDMVYLQLFNILLRKCLSVLNLQLVGRDYFDAAAKIELRDHKLELWPGYITSIRQHEDSLLLMCEITHKVMRKATAFDLMNECYEKDSRDWKGLYMSSLVGSIVLTDYNNRTYRVDDIDFDRSPKTTFDLKGENVSFKEYYKRRYNINIRSNDQPLIVSRATGRDRRAGRTGDILLIPELCRLTGITDEMRADFSTMKAIADHTRINPVTRINKLTNFISRIHQNSTANDELCLWNITLSPKLVEFEGRVLKSESIIHGINPQSNLADRSESGRIADWTKSLIHKSFMIESKLLNWVLIVHYRAARDVGNFVNTLIKSSASFKFRIPQPTVIELQDDKTPTYIMNIEKVMGERNPDLIMIVLPNNRADRYGAIKKKCCVDRPVPSQVVLAKNVSKSVMAVTSKIAIQMNCKIGGSPWGVEIPLKGLMVVGFDVTRDTQSKGHSFGALVSTLNNKLTQYFSTVTPHTSGEELSNQISLQLINSCLKYREYNKELPEKIIFYRDGVGDGQLGQVFNHEVKAIEEKLIDLYQGAPPNMTYVIVSKRINTRLFANGENPPPGTVVDHTITCPEFYDFFLVSQSVRQGTVSPTQFNIIYDTINLPPSRLQRLTYKLCHLYFNWSGTVRVPAPCQYAHKLAFLIGQAVHQAPHKALCDKLYFL